MDNYKFTIISQMIMRDVEEIFEEMSEWVSDFCTNDHMDLVQTN
jgi:hypothetical protein